MENYDPTIEGKRLVVTMCLVFNQSCRGISENHYRGWSAGFGGHLLDSCPRNEN